MGIINEISEREVMDGMVRVTPACQVQLVQQ